MSNPNNLCIFKGRIGSNLKFIKRKDGTEYACEFYLDVMRNYRNDGTYLYDSAPLRLAGEGIMPFARTLEKGDYLDVVTEFVTKTFKTESGMRNTSYFLINDISKNNKIQENERKIKKTDAESIEVSVDLPF